MNINKLLLLVLFAQLFVVPLCAIQLPQYALGQPEIFAKNQQGWNWKQIVKNKAWGRSSRNVWPVYVLNEGTLAYDASSSGNVVQRLKFMEDFFVAEIQGDRALIFYSDTKIHGLEIPEEIRTKKSIFDRFSKLRQSGYVGWVDLENLLLWDVCPMNKFNIFQRVVVVKNMRTITKENVKKIPGLYKSAACEESTFTGKYINALHFYYAFYKDDETGNMLVTTDYKMGNKMVNAEVGWIESSEYVEWNTRVCWELAFEGGINDRAYSFKDLKSVDYANFNRKRLSSNTPLVKNRRSAPEVMRSMVLEYDDDENVAKLAVIGNVSVDGNTKENTERSAEVENELQTWIEQKSNINVVFVLDATSSMDKCFSAMRKAIIRISEYRYLERVKFGVVIYRNYADAKNGKLIESCQLTDKPEIVADFLKNVECFSSSKDPQEALFAGLDYAIKNMAWKAENANFIIHISDVTTKDPDEKGLTSETIVNGLKSKNINLISFQASTQAREVYVDYCSQMTRIEKKLMKLYGYTNIVYDTNTGRSSRPKKGLPLVGIKCKDSNKPDDQIINEHELTDLVYENITYFIESARQRVDYLEGELSKGRGGGELDPTVCEELIRKKIITSCSDLKGPIKVEGYATRSYDRDENKQMYVPCVFMTDAELSKLISRIDRVTANTVQNRREELQKLCVELIQTYTGDESKMDANSFSPANLQRTIEAIEAETEGIFDNMIIAFIKNPSGVSDADLNQVIKKLNEAKLELKRVQGDSESKFTQVNGTSKTTYYYVLLDRMPLIELR